MKITSEKLDQYVDEMLTVFKDDIETINQFKGDYQKSKGRILSSEEISSIEARTMVDNDKRMSALIRVMLATGRACHEIVRSSDFLSIILWFFPFFKQFQLRSHTIHPSSQH